MSEFIIGKIVPPKNLIIQLKGKNNSPYGQYENFIIKYEDQELKIPVKKLFEKLKELFREDENE